MFATLICANVAGMTQREADPALSPTSSAEKRRAPRSSRYPRSTVALLLVSIVVPLVLFGLAALANRHDVERGAVHRVERTVRILHEHALKVFDTHQLMIDQLNERLGTFDWSSKQAVAGLHERLAHIKALLPQIDAITITDATGNLRASSQAFPVDPAINVADRDYFKALAAHDQPLPFVSASVISRQTGRKVFHLAARLRGRDPSVFAGVIVISVAQPYFTDFYRESERDYAHMVVLAREDGGVLAAEPPRDTDKLPASPLLLRAMEEGSKSPIVRPTLVDGARCIFAYEKVGDYPVVIGFGITRDSALAPWWSNMWGYGLVALLSSLALLFVSSFAIRRIALEGAATVRWRRSASRLEAEMAERAKVEELLRQSQKMEAVGRLTGGIAHDFNNLLTVVIGSLDLLSRRMPDADARQKALVHNAVDGATRAAALTARLLAFSRQHPLDPRSLDASALIDGMSNLLQRTLGETIAFECRFADDLWPSFADPNQLENAILNLCVNAADAMPKGGNLTVETANATLDAAYCASHPDLAPGDYVMVAVSDTGAGMPADVQARAFEPFFTTKSVGKGTGLGLSQVYGFARQSKGHAAIYSKPGEGTTVRIYLPRLLGAPAAVPLAAPARAAAITVAPSAAARILVVEDDELVRQFSSAILRDAGYQVVEAATGPDGLDRLRSNPDVALLFTDVVLKGPMNGRELADEIALTRPDLPVLFTTGYTKDAIIHSGRLDDGVNFIGKPFTTADLTAKIAMLLRREAPPEIRRSAAE